MPKLTVAQEARHKLERLQREAEACATAAATVQGSDGRPHTARSELPPIEGASPPRPRGWVDLDEATPAKAQTPRAPMLPRTPRTGRAAQLQKSALAATPLKADGGPPTPPSAGTSPRAPSAKVTEAVASALKAVALKQPKTGSDGGPLPLRLASALAVDIPHRVADPSPFAGEPGADFHTQQHGALNVQLENRLEKLLGEWADTAIGASGACTHLHKEAAAHGLLNTGTLRQFEDTFRFAFPPDPAAVPALAEEFSLEAVVEAATKAALPMRSDVLRATLLELCGARQPPERVKYQGDRADLVAEATGHGTDGAMGECVVRIHDIAHRAPVAALDRHLVGSNERLGTAAFIATECRQRRIAALTALDAEEPSPEALGQAAQLEVDETGAHRRIVLEQSARLDAVERCLQEIVADEDALDAACGELGRYAAGIRDDADALVSASEAAAAGMAQCRAVAEEDQRSRRAAYLEAQNTAHATVLRMADDEKVAWAEAAAAAKRAMDLALARQALTRERAAAAAHEAKVQHQLVSRAAAAEQLRHAAEEAAEHGRDRVGAANALQDYASAALRAVAAKDHGGAIDAVGKEEFAALLQAHATYATIADDLRTRFANRAATAQSEVRRSALEQQTALQRLDPTSLTDHAAAASDSRQRHTLSEQQAGEVDAALAEVKAAVEGHTDRAAPRGWLPGRRAARRFRRWAAQHLQLAAGRPESGTSSDDEDAASTLPEDFGSPSRLLSSSRRVLSLEGTARDTARDTLPDGTLSSLTATSPTLRLPGAGRTTDSDDDGAAVQQATRKGLKHQHKVHARAAALAQSEHSAVDAIVAKSRTAQRKARRTQYELQRAASASPGGSRPPSQGAQ